MEYYLDSARIDLIRETSEKYSFDGVTTNPTILARDIDANVTLSELLREIRRLTDGKRLFVQATSDTAEGIVRDAEKIVNVLGGIITVKVPSTSEGFEAVKYLKNEGISTAATACYSTSQALLAAKSGADYVAPYISHLDAMSLDGAAIAGEMARQLKFHCFETQVLAASFRTASQVERCIANGVTSVTVTAEMFDNLAAHPGTQKELASFKKNWSARFGENGIFDLI